MTIHQITATRTGNGGADSYSASAVITDEELQKLRLLAVVNGFTIDVEASYTVSADAETILTRIRAARLA